MTLEEAQKTVDEWIKTYGVRYFSELTNMAVLTEEVGELMALLPTPSRRLSSRVNPFPSIFPGPLIVISCRLIPQIREFFQWLCPKS